MKGENMGNDEKVNLLVNIARLYYEHNYSQQMIAEKLNISRPYVSKLINEAKERGIVEIRIFDPYESETQIEIDLKNKFGLNRVIVVPSIKGSDVLSSIGKAAARYLDTIIKDNDIIGVAWGTTLYSFSEQIIKRDDLKNIVVVQLCGGISNIEKNIYANEIPKKIADAYKGTPYILPLPAVLNSINVTDAIMKEKNIKCVLELANKANIAVFTMGPFGYEGALARAGYLDMGDVDELVRKGAVGDICTRIIDEEGNICDKDLNRRTIAVELTELKKKEHRIGIAVGLNRIKCIYAALKGGYANVLVTDEATASELSKMK
jgi:deoxyribonucleoside regulator